MWLFVASIAELHDLLGNKHLDTLIYRWQQGEEFGSVPVLAQRELKDLGKPFVVLLEVLRTDVLEVQKGSKLLVVDGTDG